MEQAAAPRAFWSGIECVASLLARSAGGWRERSGAPGEVKRDCRSMATEGHPRVLRCCKPVCRSPRAMTTHQRQSPTSAPASSSSARVSAGWPAPRNWAARRRGSRSSTGGTITCSCRCSIRWRRRRYRPRTSPGRSGGSSSKDSNIDVVMAEVVGFDTAARRVRLRDGSVLPYDKLVVATGSGIFLLRSSRMGALRARAAEPGGCAAHPRPPTDLVRTGRGSAPIRPSAPQ